MKKIISIVLLLASVGSAESLLDPINDLGLGTVKLKAQTLSMYRDFEGAGNGYSTTLGWTLDYLSTEWEGLSAGVSVIHVDVLHAAGGAHGSNGETLLSNGNVNEMNELWVKYRLGALGLSNTFVKVGRQVLNTEVLRSDAFRQKARSFESAILVTKDIPNTTLIVGHTEKMSNVYTGVTNLEIAAYDEYAHDVANIAGGRIKYTLSENTALNGYYRHETDVGNGADHSSDMFGASIQQKIGGVTIEPGFLSIGGDGLLFTERTTGINHPLGSSMMLYGEQFQGGADTYYIKATTKIDKTILYALYNYTTHDTQNFEGQELNFVIKQPITDKLTVALKTGVGYRDNKGTTDDTVASDTRLFVTYNF